MTLEIKKPTRTDNWTCSDGRTFDSEGGAHGHEVFLAVLPLLKGMTTGYAAVCELARHFDFVPRPGCDTGAAPTPNTKSKPLRPLCSVCGEPQDETPHGLVCVNGHGGADSL